MIAESPSVSLVMEKESMGLISPQSALAQVGIKMDIADLVPPAPPAGGWTQHWTKYTEHWVGGTPWLSVPCPESEPMLTFEPKLLPPPHAPQHVPPTFEISPMHPAFFEAQSPLHLPLRAQMTSPVIVDESPVKLSALLRMGAPYFEQVFGQLFETNAKGQIGHKACALGVILATLGMINSRELDLISIEHFILKHTGINIFNDYSQDLRFSGTGYLTQETLYGQIVFLNDKLKWPFPQIADWLQGHGF